MKAILLFFALALISKISCDVIFTCPDDKSKIKGICALITKNADGKDVLNIFSKCSEGKICTENGDIFQCIYLLKLRKLGQSCTYNEDCYSGNCEGEHCKAAKSCSNDDQCAGGYVCAYEGRDKKVDEKSCVKGAKEGESYNKYRIDEQGNYYKEYEDRYLGGCLPFFIEYKSEPIEEGTPKKIVGYKYTCTKMFSLDNGKETINRKACKSGFIVRQADGREICDSVISVGGCKELAGSSGEYFETVKFEISGELQVDCSCGLCINLRKGEYATASEYSSYKARSKLATDLVEIMEDLDLEDIQKYDKNGNYIYPLKWTDNKKYLLWLFADIFYYSGFINDEGEIEDVKKCEVDWFIKYFTRLSGSSLKLSLFLIFVIVLFTY